MFDARAGLQAFVSGLTAFNADGSPLAALLIGRSFFR
jgi:hypothetical protein